MTSSIGIDSHEYIIFIWAYFYGCVNVGTLEACIEDDTITRFESRVHAFEWSTMFWLEMRIELPKVSSQMWEVSIDDSFIFIVILSPHLLMHFKATGIPRTYLSSLLPR